LLYFLAFLELKTTATFRSVCFESSVIFVFAAISLFFRAFLGKNRGYLKRLVLRSELGLYFRLFLCKNFAVFARKKFKTRRRLFIRRL